MTIGKLITAYGGPAFIMCDARCDKAWGLNDRPKERLSDDEDDIVWLADDELGTAPADPGTSEGDVRKPTRPEDRLNRWCFRACERATWAGHQEQHKLVQLKDWTKRVYNIPNKHRAEEDGA